MHSPSPKVPPMLAALPMLDHELLKHLTLFRIEHTLNARFRCLQNVVDPLPHLLMCGFQFRAR